MQKRVLDDIIFIHRRYLKCRKRTDILAKNDARKNNDPVSRELLVVIRRSKYNTNEHEITVIQFNNRTLNTVFNSYEMLDYSHLVNSVVFVCTAGLESKTPSVVVWFFVNRV